MREKEREKTSPLYTIKSRTMALSQSHGVAPEVDYVIVTRGDGQDEGLNLKHRARSSATTPPGHVSQHSYTTRQAPRSEDWSYESDSEDEFESFLPKSSPTSTLRPSLLPATTSLGSAAVALAQPAFTGVKSLTVPGSLYNHKTRVSTQAQCTCGQ